MVVTVREESEARKNTRAKRKNGAHVLQMEGKAVKE